MHKSEKDFSKALIKELENHRAFITRIETRGTINGVPDMFISVDGKDCWLELKNESGLNYDSMYKSFKVHWRPGQISWAYRYYIAHNKAKCSFTLCALKDGYVLIPMQNLFKDNKVSTQVKYVADTLKGAVDFLLANI